jgi:hypothetical protein
MKPRCLMRSDQFLVNIWQSLHMYGHNGSNTIQGPVPVSCRVVYSFIICRVVLHAALEMSS